MGRELTLLCRGIAILMIMAAHIVGTFNGLFANFLDPRLLTPWGGVGVAIFLFLSGYGLVESYKINGLYRFWQKKFLRVLSPYILWCILNQLVLLITPLSIEKSNIIIRYWFIEYLLVWYFVFYIAYRFIPKHTVLVFFIASIMMFFIYPSDLQAEQSLSFSCGAVFSRNKEYMISFCKKHYYIIFLSLFVIGFAALGIKQLPVIRCYSEGSPLFKLVQLFIKLPLGLSLLMLLSRLNIKGTVLLFVGTISYELYLVHMPYLGGINNNYFNVLVLLVQSFLLSYCVYRVNKQVVKRIQRVDK